MARGGVKKPVNVFKLKDLGEPEGVFNWRLWFAVVSFGLLGAARGIDEGLITGAFNTPAFQRAIHYSDYSETERADIKANVSAMVQIGSAGGALMYFWSFIVCDKIGRIWAVRFLCSLWILGIVISMIGGVKNSLGAIYAGRLIAGLGVGQTPVVGPIYIGEISPPSVRGLCTCFFTGSVYVGIVLAYFSNYGGALHLHGHTRWLVPTSLHIMMSGLILVLSFFQYESPRFLIKQGKSDKAAQVLSRLRQQPVDSDYIATEVTTVQTALALELEATKGIGWWGKVKEVFTVPSNLYRFYLATMVQILSQWSGAGSITVYAPDLFKLLGVTGNEESLLVTAVFGLVKFAAAIICALFLVDVVGRKRSLLIGITFQSLSILYIAAFLTAVPELGVKDNFILPNSDKGASKGAIAMIYISGVGWALGWNSMQYLITAELFPLRIRALTTSWAMALHFANQYGNSRALPSMLLPFGSGGLSPKGTFWCLGSITVIGGFWVWFFVPETGGRSLESMGELFELSWYRIGLHGNEDAEQRDLQHEFGDKQSAIENQDSNVQQVENLSKV